jgi:periplasmic protein TonB
MSSLGRLTQCLVDSDEEARSRAKRLRAKALLLSLIIEAALIAATLIWPLITPGVLSGNYVVVPTPPYPGGGRSGHAHPNNPIHPPTSSGHALPICLNCNLPPVHPHSGNADSTASGSSRPSDDVWDGDGSGEGPGIPGGSGHGNPLDSLADRDPPPPRAPVKMSQGVMAASLVNKVDPAYPPVARAAHISGKVVLRAIIGTDGAVREIQVMSGSPLLAQAARAAVEQWRYRPTLLSGEPVEVETLITVDFRLE